MDATTWKRRGSACGHLICWGCSSERSERIGHQRDLGKRSPRIVTDREAMQRPGVLTASEISCLVIPDGCLGLPTLAALEQRIPVITVRENHNVNGVPDECEADFDEDGAIDDCDADIDDDGIPNESDDCLFTPLGNPINEQGRSIGDLDGDCLVTLSDYLFFVICLDISGPGDVPAFNDCIEAFDFDGDRDVDVRDFSVFQRSIVLDPDG